MDRHSELNVLETSIVLYCKELKDAMPNAGMRELYACCVRHFKEKMVIGRDSCYEVLRSNGLVLRKKHKRPKTTNSNHNYYIYPDLLNTSPKFQPDISGRMMVADITYVATRDGWAYLSLITDAYSRAIVGYSLHPTLEADGPIAALKSAFLFYKEHNIDISRLIHHSDRGVQYCSNDYIKELKIMHTSISMTQCGDPLHNALAERMNNTIKNGWLSDCGGETFEQVEKCIEKAVSAYNNVPPHQALKMRTPMEILEEDAARYAVQGKTEQQGTGNSLPAV